MKKEKYALTGEGFTIEEADELLRGYKRPPMTAEQRQEYLAVLEQFAERIRAERAEAAAEAEHNGVARAVNEPSQPTVPMPQASIAPAPTDSPC